MKRILIIEDQSDIRRLIRWSLEVENYTFQEATNGAAGLTAAQAFRPALVLLDVMMPGGVDGLEVCRQLKADTGLGPPLVVLLSARAQQRDREAGLEAGADAYLTKPFSPAELSTIVERLLATPATAAVAKAGTATA
jgi:DNA-binding response OmpR family regulator